VSKIQDKVTRRSFDQNIANVLHSKPLAGRVLAARGLKQADEVELHNKQLPHPKTLADFDKAIALIADAVVNQKSILVVGDYDADGATSTVLAVHSLRNMKARVSYLVPNRFQYGYGLSPEIVGLALEQNSKPDMIVTVDNGIASNEGVARAVDAGITVVVTDHHLPPDELPGAHALVNPNRRDCKFPSKNLCGVGVIFYVMTGLCRHLQQAGWFKEQKIDVPNMASYLDLVALGTVADVVPFDRTNRILVDQGIKRIRANETRPGITALFEVAKRSQARCLSHDLGFFIGPRLNAAGRLTDMTEGIECLLATTPAEAMKRATRLNEINSRRRSIQASMQKIAEEKVEQLMQQLSAEPPAALALYDPSWHEGVVGIVAGKIKEHYNRPVFAFARSTDGTLKGSGRSIADVHIRDVLMDIVSTHPGLLKKFGGHAMAAGVSLDESRFDEFNSAFSQQVSQRLNGKSPTREWITDGELDDDEISLENAELMQFLQPWGQSFEAPLFDGIFHIEATRLLRNAHSRVMIRRPDGKRKLPAVAFNRQIDSPAATRWRMVYRLEVNEYRNNQSLQLLIEHMEPADD